MAVLAALDRRFTSIALALDERVGARSLLNVPSDVWRWFSRGVMAFFLMSTICFTMGIICFCLGMQYSLLYSEVNCSDGTTIWIPLLNLTTAFVGLFTVRTLHLHWPAAIFALSLTIVIILNIVPIADSIWMAIRWFNAKRTARDAWAGNYAVIDLFIAGLTVLLEMIALFLLAIIGKYWCRSVNH